MSCPRWAEWDGWTLCTVSCGTGTRYKHRRCTDNESFVDTYLCYQEYGVRYGSDIESEECNSEDCPCNISLLLKTRGINLTFSKLDILWNFHFAL